jgi:SNF2 family DNA or RNA helicase
MKEPGALAISSDSEFAPSADEDDSTGSDSEFEPSQFERVQTVTEGAPPRSRLVKVSPAPRSATRVPARSNSRAKPTPKPKAKTSKGGRVGGSSKKRSIAKKTGGKRAPKGRKRAAGGSSSSEGESSSSSTSSDDDSVAGATKAKGKGKGKGKGAAAAALVEHAAAGTFKDQDGLDLSTSVLHCVRWSRVVLDEAHKIKSRTNSTAKAAFCLSADVRWCLTGTPLQNRVSELYSLIRFLQCDPFAYYLCSCKGCTCQSMHWQFGPSQRACEGCGHPKMQHYAYFNKHIINPIKRYGYVGQGKTAMLTLKNQVLDKVMLRRTKKERAAELKLPKLNIEVRKLALNEAERDFYECIYKQTRSRFDTFVDKGTLLHNYAHVFELLSRLRQAVDHPYLVIHGSYKKKPASFPSKSARRADVCGICTLDILSARDCAINACRHTFHRDCILDYAGEGGVGGPGDGGGGATTGKGAKGKRGKRGKGKTKEIGCTAKDCPVCFQPLKVTLDLRGMGDSEDDDDDDDDDGNDDGDGDDSGGINSPSPSSSRRRSSSTGGGDGPKKKKARASGGGGGGAGATSPPGVGARSPEPNAENSICVVCMERPRDALLLPCGHVYTCMECVSQFRQRTCPICRAPIQRVIRADRSELVKEAAARLTSSNGGGGGGGGGRKAESSVLLGRESIVQQLDMNAFASSTKIDAVVDEVVLIRKKDKREKTIIFSQYNRMIDLVEAQLKLKGFQTVKLMGFMPIAQRKSVLDAFKTEPNISVILMSLKAGGEGLNLQEANHVLVLEPWWNPQVEMQAIQRAHRIGQTRDVHAVRFITEGSIEDRMLELQNKKQLIFEGAVDSNATALSQLTQEDLQFLFGGN